MSGDRPVRIEAVAEALLQPLSVRATSDDYAVMDDDTVVSVYS
jgi:hypothetical protein